jgi:hypothetical protein
MGARPVGPNDYTGGCLKTFHAPGSCITRQTFPAGLGLTPHGIRSFQGLLGHSDLNSTMISTRDLNRGGQDVRSPSDSL